MESNRLVKIICLAISLIMAALLLYYLYKSCGSGWGWSLWAYGIPAIPVGFSFYFALKKGDERERIASCMALLVVLVIFLNLPGAAYLLEEGIGPSDLAAKGEFDILLSSVTVFALFFIPSMAIVYVESEEMKNGLKRLGFKPERRLGSSIAWGLLLTIITFMLVVLASTIMSLVASSLGYKIPMENPLAERMSSSSLLIIVLPILAGIGEEIFFRGILQSRFGIVVQAIVFGLAHVAYLIPQQVILPMVMAVLWGYAYKITKDIRIVITSHIAYNFIAMLTLHFLGDYLPI